MSGEIHVHQGRLSDHIMRHGARYKSGEEMNRCRVVGQGRDANVHPLAATYLLKSDSVVGAVLRNIGSTPNETSEDSKSPSGRTSHPQWPPVKCLRCSRCFGRMENSVVRVSSFSAHSVIGICLLRNCVTKIPPTKLLRSPITRDMGSWNVRV